ncbi:MAG: MltA domain-containing protein, partial [Hyphomicrobiaceae bacterium]
MKTKSDKAATGTAAKPEPPAPTPAVTFQSVGFESLPGWSDDDHLAALKAFAKSCSRVVAAVRAGNRSGATPPPPELLSACADAAQLLAGKPTRAAARRFFESHFEPHRVVHADRTGMLTAYYEPVIEGSRTASSVFTAPVYRRPPDLLNLVSEGERGARADQLTHARRTPAGWEPYPTRQQIEEGALAGQGLELVFLKDPVELFFMQVQGSGRIDFGDGTSMRVTYDGKNGHPYTSIGRY